MSDEKRNRDLQVVPTSKQDSTAAAEHEDSLDGVDAKESARALQHVSPMEYRYRPTCEERLVGVFEFPPEFPQKLLGHIGAKMERRQSSASSRFSEELMAPTTKRAETALAGGNRTAINIATEALLEIESVLEVLHDIDVASSTPSLQPIAQRTDIQELRRAVIESIKSYNATGLPDSILQTQRAAAELNAAWFTALNVPLDAQGMCVLGIEAVPEVTRKETSLIREF